MCTFWRTKNGIFGGKIIWSLFITSAEEGRYVTRSVRPSVCRLYYSNSYERMLWKFLELRCLAWPKEEPVGWFMAIRTLFSVFWITVQDCGIQDVNWHFALYPCKLWTDSVDIWRRVETTNRVGFGCDAFRIRVQAFRTNLWMTWTVIRSIVLARWQLCSRLRFEMSGSF